MSSKTCEADNKTIIPKSQYGFQPGFSTIHQLDMLKSDIVANRNKKKSTRLVLLDSRKGVRYDLA